MIEKIALECKTALSKYQYELLGREAARDYLSRDIPLNESIEKIAEEKDLNSKQIERICECANKEVYLHLFKKGNVGEKTGTAESYEKYVTFDLADASKIKASMSKEAAMSPAVNPMDYYSNIPKEFQRDIHSIDIRVPAMEKTASRNEKQAYDLLEKLQSAKQMFEGMAETAEATILLESLF